MLRTGLVSLTFRNLPPKDIIVMVAANGLEGIEWAGNVHVPPSDISLAQTVRSMTTDAGLQVAAYGSFYYAGETDSTEAATVVKTAIALHTPTIRIWAGKLGSAQADITYRKRVADAARAIAELAADAGIAVAFEFHHYSLTDTYASALDLLDMVHNNNTYLYWQPDKDLTQDERIQGLQAVLPNLRNIHVMHIDNGRQLLASAGNVWLDYLKMLPPSTETHWASIEFVKNDSPTSFAADARTLSSWVRDVEYR